MEVTYISSTRDNFPRLFLGLLLYPEDRGSGLLRNVNFLADYTASLLLLVLSRTILV
jgi:hypothetical protein